MPTTTRTSTKEPARRFEIVVEPAHRPDGRFGLTLRESNGQHSFVRDVAHVPPDRLGAIAGALADALRSSGQPRTALKATRKAPIPLAEDAGVRAALALNVVHGVSKPGRTARLLDGISRLSDEECFYWYAHTLGEQDDSTRRRRFKALRIFLAQE